MCLALAVAACASPASSPTLPVGSPTAEPPASASFRVGDCGGERTIRAPNTVTIEA
jgi:hypothetical protein